METAEQTGNQDQTAIESERLETDGQVLPTTDNVVARPTQKQSRTRIRNRRAAIEKIASTKYEPLGGKG